MASDSNSSQPQPPLALPAPASEQASTADETDTKKLDVSSGVSESVKFDELGPVVVNSDGTLSRISNWASLTELERERTVRVLVARNNL
ncbi:hypothetical protein BDN72DRAFT_842377 [Pluteus cervinus]|uniref:Uncharacterized protein n=1 Tax=Pluteus cervinus TaxID=181527 RepID=A0ACD3AQI7_9AGAR|nr:hypothetical protein BDN72DRAFT_842377 [Pluteus cervinus]